MDRDVNIELALYRALAQYKPRVGDVIIKHGWFVSVKWFGVINFIDQEGQLHIIRTGLPKLLFSMPKEKMPSNTIRLPNSLISQSISGSYSVMQQESSSNMPVWYV